MSRTVIFYKLVITACILFTTGYLLTCIWSWTSDYPEVADGASVWYEGDGSDLTMTEAPGWVGSPGEIIYDVDPSLDDWWMTAPSFATRGPQCFVTMLEEVDTFETNCTCDELWKETGQGWPQMALAYLFMCRRGVHEHEIPDWNNTYTD